MPLTVERMSFDSSAKEAWVGGWKVHRPPATFAALRPSFLTEILAAKAQIRPNRFFGEAYVAGQWGYDDAWYSSYKWLTSARWTSATKARDPLNQRFKSALRTHFPKLSELQTRAIAAEAELGVRPVAPDLWLLRRGEHWFLEVKILPDDVADTQWWVWR